VIEYAQGDRLYVPKEFMHLVQKYIPCCGAGKRLRRRPHIYKLGSKEWQRVRNRAKRGIERMSFELLRIQAARNNVSGFKFSRDADWQARFEQGFPWAETPGQAKCIQDVKRDMQQARPMDRLICGDVGYGKTEVAMRAAFKAVLDNKQVAFLVPTTILAEQHFQNLKERIKDFPIKIAMLSRFRSKKEQGEVVEGLIRGRVDIVIGTHRLLSRDLVFKDLGLLIIDEEQRFGVRAKERLKSLRLTVDVLTLTATPIPRTLYMGLMQVRDMSVIETPPAQRLAVETQVHCFDTGLIRQAIANELRRKGQVYFVHNRILDIDDVAARLRRLSPPRARVMTAHGAMPARGLEKVMAEFLRGDIDVLVCTMIIQSGIDVPNANTLIVNNAERFGLSDLHQLRGRIGRFKRRAYAFFLISGKGVPDERARARLSAITNYSALGSGFKIAFEDMVLRGTGNLLGPQQHGYINAIGFDLYCRLLREVVSFGKNKI
ncbi:MAG: DEAD/DEAH box helicase, partial [Candidatus Omnitrophota bacterium]